MPAPPCPARERCARLATHVAQAAPVAEAASPHAMAVGAKGVPVGHGGDGVFRVLTKRMPTACRPQPRTRLLLGLQRMLSLPRPLHFWKVRLREGVPVDEHL